MAEGNTTIQTRKNSINHWVLYSLLIVIVELELFCIDFLKHSDVNHLTTDDECTRHETLAACYQLAQSVLKIGGIGGGRRVSARGAVHMAAALAVCRKALVGTLRGVWSGSVFSARALRLRTHAACGFAVSVNDHMTSNVSVGRV